MMNQKDLALMTNRLEVPLVVKALVEQNQEIEDDIHYGLHEALSDMQPDTALLAITISAKAMAGMYAGTNSGSEIISMACERIISEYGPLWLENARIIDSGNIKAMNNAYLVSLLENIPEDLETLSELININLSYAAFDNAAVAQICEILQIQADAHAIIAEEFLSLMEKNAAEGKKPKAKTPAAIITAKGEDNIVHFPV